jgi:hypothetical protein
VINTQLLSQLSLVAEVVAAVAACAWAPLCRAVFTAQGCFVAELQSSFCAVCVTKVRIIECACEQRALLPCH